MVKVTLKGNYNVPIEDLGLQFGPEKNEVIISKADYESSADFKYFAEFFDVEPVGKKTVADSENKEKPKTDVKEVPPAKKIDEPEIVDATDASLSEGAKETKERVEAKQDEDVVDATGASQNTKSEKESKVVEQDSKPAAEKTTGKKSETKATDKKKAGRPKKVK